MFKVSHSKIKTARRCHRAYFYKYVAKLRKRTKSRPLIVGSLVHECLESYFRDGHYLPVIRKWKELEYNKMFKEEQVLHADIIPLVKQLIRGYINQWDNRNLTMLWVEKSFELEISPGIILVGKIDGRARCHQGMEWLVEHKTCKKMPDETTRQFDTQAVLYNAVLPLMNEKPVQGVLWDYVRTKLPAKPELLAKGGLSTAKKIDTLPEVYLREIKRHGLDPVGYKDILEHLELKRDSFYREIRLPFSNEFSNNIMQEFVITSNEMKRREDNYKVDEDMQAFTCNPSRDCSWCDYENLCYAQLRGDDISYILKHDFRRRSKDGSESIPIKIVE